jgi:F0F1-type ATP synthase membrane subunit b/b'
MEGYRLQENARSDALEKRSEALAQARKKAEQMALDSRDSILNQVNVAKAQLGREAEEMARDIVASIMQ